MSRRPPTAIDQYEALSTVLRLVRGDRARTRPELGATALLGRTVISQRVEEAMGLGLLEDADIGPSNGGRAPRRLRFRAEQGLVLCAVLGAAALDVAVTDLDGRVLDRRHLEWRIARGPEQTLDFLDEQFTGLLEDRDPERLWAVVIGVPGPVEFATGRPSQPPIMPGWDGYDIRGRLQRRWGVPVWVDNDANLLALGEARTTGLADDQHLIFVKAGTGIGAGIVSRGRIHRGSKGAAGDIGHARVQEDNSTMCRCGRTGCLEALAGGWALARDAVGAVHEGRSRFLADIHRATGEITPADIGRGVVAGDAWCLTAVARAAERIGSLMAALVNFYDPDCLVFGGGAVTGSDTFLRVVDHTVRSRALPLASEGLTIRSSVAGDTGVVGGAHLAVEALLSADALAAWAPGGSPSAVAPERLVAGA
ncbi:ROK family protein [Streptomyces leeuwenhoekii]|uniref:Glucokinase n=1 Tax=Streptomyces leeuwenhoekii TaxID=1437453 RepID=A0A0F7W0L8_STRLW|nr:ROK family protein [Streptomyces leeuwenhoekii]CQR65560.1 Glucokinase [Streptomyces leeuwenhoekii]